MKISEFTVSGRPVPFKRHVGQGRAARNDPRYKAWRDEVILRALEAYRGAVNPGVDILVCNLTSELRAEIFRVVYETIRNHREVNNESTTTTQKQTKAGKTD